MTDQENVSTVSHTRNGIRLLNEVKLKAERQYIRGCSYNEIEATLTSLVKLNISFVRKFNVLYVHNFLWVNYQQNVSLCNLVDGIRSLVELCRNFILNEEQRQKDWSQIFWKEHKWNCIEGWKEILNSIGYSKLDEDYLRFPPNSILDQGRISSLVCDLILLCVELERCTENENGSEIEFLFITKPNNGHVNKIIRDKKEGCTDLVKFIPSPFFTFLQHYEKNSVPETTFKSSEQDKKESKMVLKRGDEQRVHDGQHCDLCGCSAPAVRCEKCSLQMFCLSCDAMYHRHPKRKSHVRKPLVPGSTNVVKSEHDANPHRLPVPPPRKKKSQLKSVPSSPLFFRKSNENPPLPKKEFSFMEKVGSLRRMMIGRPLPPLPKEDPVRSPPQPPRKLSSTLSTYSNVSDNDGPTYANESATAGAEWNDGFNLPKSSYPSSLNKSDTDSGIQMGFQGFPILPKKDVVNNSRASTMSRGINSSSVCDLPNRPMPIQGMQMPQAQSIQGLNYVHPMAGGYVDPYMGWINPHWVHPNYYPPFPIVESLKRTPSNSSMNYACSESGMRINSYASMGHLHNPMMSNPYNNFPIPPQYIHRPHSPTNSTRSARLHNKSMGRRNTAHGYLPGRRSQNTSSEDDYYSASDEEELRAANKTSKHESRGWQCEHCTYINEASTKICNVCCKTGGISRSGERRRRKGGGVKSPSSGDSLTSSRPGSASAKVNENNKSPVQNEERPTEITKNFAGLNVSPSLDEQQEMKEKDATEKKEGENQIKIEGNEPQTKMTSSTGTSPPPQDTGTQTNPINQSDELISDDPAPRPFYRAPSQSSINDIITRRSSNNDHWSNYPRSSRNSVFGGNSRDPSPVRSYRAENELSYRSYPYEPVNRTDYYLNLEEMIERRRQETMRSQGFELVRLLREAEQNNFTADDLQVAMSHCGSQNAVQWLLDNWKNMVDTVVTLVTNFGKDKKENDIGIISSEEAKESLRSHKGNVWAAVTDCVEIRQRKFSQLKAKGDFNAGEIVSTLTANKGNVDEAYLELCRNWTKPFHMKIWGPPIGVENESGTGFMFDKNIGNSSAFSSEKSSLQEPLIGVRDNSYNKMSTIEHNTPVRVKGIGSLSGGSFKERTNNSPPISATFSALPPLPTLSGVATTMPTTMATTSSFAADVEDPYVTLQWNSGKNLSSFQQNRQPSSQRSLQSNVQANFQTNFQQNCQNQASLQNQQQNQANLQNQQQNQANLQNQQQNQANLQNQQQNQQQDLQSKFQTNFQQNFQTNFQQNSQPNRQQNLQPNFQMNFQQNHQPNFETNFQQNSQPNLQPNRPQNLQTNLQPPPLDENTIYTTLQELVSQESPSTPSSPPSLLPKFPLMLEEKVVDAKEKKEVIVEKKEMVVEKKEIVPEKVEIAEESTQNETEKEFEKEFQNTEEVVTSIINQDVIDAATESILASAQMLIQEEEPKYKNKSNDVERRARILLAEGRVSSYNEAEIVVMLTELNFTEEDAFTAARECSDVDSAISFLQQDCELCVAKYPMGKMVSMLNCSHRCCQKCAKIYFTTQIRDRNIMEAICPFCNEPDLTDDQVAPEYFNNLDILLRNLVDEDIHELFQRKITDRALMRDPNFRWCSQCSSGFIADPFTIRLHCPDCQAVTCALCRKPWEVQHNGISCELFAQWKEANDPEYQAKGLEKHLEENGIDCPNCKFRYSLAKGGCMHFRCIQCKYDFCSGCGRPFKIGSKCNFAPVCAKLGLHAHHPRNCLFYLRDKDPKSLQKLLEQNGVTFDTEPKNIEGAQVGSKCQVMEQKEIPSGLKDDICGNDVEEGNAGLCKLHFIEYLVGLICKKSIDPVAIFDVNDLQQELRRWQKEIPVQEKRQSDQEYRNFLCKIITQQIPLDEFNKR